MLDLDAIKQQLENELFERVVPFWLEHSRDLENGGFYNCLDRDGSVYDSTKHIWLQGRQTWMLSRLYQDVDQNEAWMTAAKSGMDFILKHAVTDEGRAYFSMNAEGEPIYMQRKIFSECFIIMALAQLSRISGDDKLMGKAKWMFEKVWTWSKDTSVLGRPKLAGQEPMRTLAIPMIMLNLIEELCGDDQKMRESFSAEIDACINLSLSHYDEASGRVYENVGLNGEVMGGYEGRILNPGHAIEAGWFMIHWGRTLGRDDLVQKAIKIIRNSHDLGWDKDHGGLFYFLDAEGYSPIQLEWSMKLWWPHTEALYAHLLAYRITGEEEDAERFQQVLDYTMSHFLDDKYNGWYGYCDQQGRVSHRFKGGPYKGFFHVPRALHFCLQELGR